MLMSPFVRLELNEKLWCEAGAASSTRAILTKRHFASSPVEVLAVDDSEPLSFQFPRRLLDGRAHHALAALRPQLVARLVLWESKTTQIYRERRLRGTIIDGSAERGLVSVRAESLLLDLAKCGPMRELVNGLPNYTFSLTDLDGAAILAFIVAKAVAQGLTWLAAGGCEPPFSYVAPDALALERATPLAAAQQFVGTLHDRDLLAELALEQTPTAYELAIRSQKGSGITLSPFHPRAGQLNVRRTVDASEQATRVYPLGAPDPDGAVGIWGRARFPVSNVNGGTNTFEISVSGGGGAPILVDGQFVLPTAWKIYRVATGETFTITATVAPTVAGGPAIITCDEIEDLANGEFIEFRVDEPETNQRHVKWDATTPVERALFEVTAIDVPGGKVTVALKWTNGDPITDNDMYIGWRARLNTKVVGPVTSTGSNGLKTYTIPSVAAVQVGDWILPAANTTAPYTVSWPTAPTGNIDSIDVPNNRVHIGAARYQSVDPVGNNSVVNGTRIFRPVAGHRRIIDAIASTNEFQLGGGVSGISVGDVLIIEQPYGAGELPSYVEHPTSVQAQPTGYGVQCADVPVPSATGLQELGTNGWFRTWTGGSSAMPDGLTKHASQTVAKNTDPLHVYRGVNSIYLFQLSDWIQCERFYPSPAPGRDRLSLRVWIKIVAWGGNFSTPILLELYEAAPNGTASGAALASTALWHPDEVTDEAKATLGLWMSMGITGFTITPWMAPFGFVARLSASIDLPELYVGGFERFGHATLPETSIEFSDATRQLQAGNRHLRGFHYPQRYDLAAINLGAQDSGRRLDTAIGGNVPVIQKPYGIDTTERLMRAELVLFDPKQSQVTLARRSDRLTHMLNV